MLEKKKPYFSLILSILSLFSFSSKAFNLTELDKNIIVDKVNKISPERKDIMNLDKYVYPFLDNINKIIISYGNLVNNSFISKLFLK